MAILRLDGGWYADARPDGAFAVLIPGLRIDTHRGPLALPPGGNLLYLRLAPDGIRFAGAGHDDDRVWEWTGREWVDRGHAYGVSPVIYRGDALLINGIHDAWGSQGARWVDNLGFVWTGDETYYSSKTDLSEWSAITPDIAVGQSHPDGTNDAAWVWDNGTHRLLEPGPCRFIRAHRDGERVSIAIWKPGQGAVVHWLTLDEIRALPVVTLPKPNEPKKDPEPKPMSLPDPQAVLRVLQRERNKYPAKFTSVPEMNAALGVVLNNTAREFPGMGMHRKDGEKAASYPGIPVTFSRDTLRVYDPSDPGDELGYWSDVLGATGALIGSANAPEWKRSSDNRASFVSPVAAPKPDEPKDPQPGLTLEQRVERIERWIQRAL